MEANKPIKVARYEHVVIINNKMYQEVADLGCKFCDYMKDKTKCDLDICPCVGETMLKEINMEK